MFSRVRIVREQGGFALPTVMLMSIAAFSVASVALLSSMSSQGNTIHDQRSKSSFATAESGVSDAMLRYNLTAAPTACAPVGGSPDGNGWCPPVTISPAVNGGSVQYWVHPPSLTPSRRCQGTSTAAACMEVVALGTLNGVTRRVDVTATTSSGTGLFADAAVKATDSISLDSNAEIHSGVATGGPMSLSSNAKQCGQVSVGVGQALTLSANAQYNTDVNCTQQATTYAQAPLTLPPVNQGDAPSNNNNSRFFGLDVAGGHRELACFNGVNADGTAGSCGPRELAIGGNGTTVTLGGSVYSLCKLTMTQNSKLYTATGAQVKIYFDSPEACGQPSGTTQMLLSSNTRISPPNIAPSSVALLFVGSTSRATSIQLNSNTQADALCQQNFVVYAPLTNINMNSNSQYCGALAAKTLHLDQHAVVTTGSGTSSFTLPGTAAYYTLDPAGFVECSAATASPPNAGC
ncbi:MAG: hypothetical protein QOG93_630 [Gaiellaceae bacterium]|nr:hypothetical protein [Gaiellaceae bacterium]